MKKQMHLAAQFLATAAISFLEKKEDDSHTNLGFNTETGCLETHLLSKNNDQLLLSYETFSLTWKSNSGDTTLRLDNTTHKEVISWIAEVSEAALNRKYSYALHYELPYTVDDSFVYTLSNFSELRDLMHFRMLTQFSLEEINQEYNLQTNIRVWPHHFDTGIYTNIPDSSVSISQGLAIPDDMCNDHYLYASGYNADGQIDPSGFNDLKTGHWSKEGFKGAMLPVHRATEESAIAFFKETLDHYKKI